MDGQIGSDRFFSALIGSDSGISDYLPDSLPIHATQSHCLCSCMIMDIEQSILWQKTHAAEFEGFDTEAESSASPDVAVNGEKLSARNMSQGESERIQAGMYRISYFAKPVCSVSLKRSMERMRSKQSKMLQIRAQGKK
jgi:hypothetical protein